MKKILIIMTFLITSMSYVIAQEVTLNLENVKLKKALTELEKQTGYSFSYSSHVVDANRRIAIDTEKKQLSQILDELFANSGVEYKIQGKKILLKNVKQQKRKKKNVKLKTVKGRIVDDLGAVVGASVVVKGTTNGVNTDLDGNFTLNDVPENATVEISYIGYQSLELPANANFSKVRIKEDSQMLDEVIVTGISKTDKRLFTGAATKLKSDDMKIEGLPDISRSLEGRSAGVSVQNVSGTFGAAPKIRVRGATSIYGNSKPLWVVDGVVMEDVIDISSDDLASGDATTLISSAIAGLNPDDVESFDILKDGSATSIYGAKAMAGVIVITTKKGKKGKSLVSYQGSYTYRDIPRYSDYNIMNSQQEMSVFQELEKKGLLDVSKLINGSESGVFATMYKRMYKLDANGNFLLNNDYKGRVAYLKAAEFRNTDWFEELFERNVLQTHSVSFSSGTDKSSFYGSLSAMVDPGWMKTSGVKRYTGNFNSSFDIYKNLKLKVLSNASLRKQKAPGTLGRGVDAFSGAVTRSFDINPYSFALSTARSLDPNAYYTRNYAPFNIKKELEENYIDLKVLNLKFQSELEFRVNDKITLSGLGALKYVDASSKHNITEFSNLANAYRAGTKYLTENTIVRQKNPYLYTDKDNPYAVPISILPKGGMLQTLNNSLFGYDFRGTATYKNVFNMDHSLNVFAGAELSSTDRNTLFNYNHGVQYGYAKTAFYDYRFFKQAIEQNSPIYRLGETRDRSLAFFGNVTYSWKRKYILNGTLRYEGTNKLGKSTSARWLPTWNISGAWHAHDERFFKKLDPIVNSLTLKASYSLTADRGPASVSNSLVDVRTTIPFRPLASQRETAMYIHKLENSELTYEKKNEINLGFESSLFHNRVGVTFDWYSRNNYDLIGPVSSQGIGGDTQRMGNVASMKSRGVEFSLATTNIKTGDFTWVTNFVYSKASNIITSLKSRKRVIDLVRSGGFGVEGYPVRSIFSIPFKGLNSEGLPTFMNQNGETTVSDIYLQEREKIGFLEYSGSADPTDMGSLGNIIKYKGLELNIFTTYSFGNVIRLEPSSGMNFSDFNSMSKELNDRWIVPGDEKRTTVPVIPDQRTIRNYTKTNLAIAYNAYNYSTERIAKGDFIRLKEVSLAYNFPKRFLERLKISRLSMKLQATNLFLLYSDDKLKGQDPEFLNSGGVAAPVPRQVTFTVNLSI